MLKIYSTAVGLCICSAILFSLLAFTSPFAEAETSDCPTHLSQSAELAVASIQDWTGLYNSFEAYKTCDDGAVAEGFSDKVTNLLANNWGMIALLGKRIARDRSFKTFILRHINETSDPNDLRAILSNIESKGCKGLRQQTCSEIRRETETALKELNL